MKIADPAHTAVRGDLAHVALAGRYFVPHYAVPSPHVVKAGGADLCNGGNREADALARLAAGSRFDVLDIAGGYAWGQCATESGSEGGLVGYVEIDRLDPVP